MKRLLGIILALAMLVSMIPAVFAEETATEVEDLSITFDFRKGGRSDVNQTSLETVSVGEDSVYKSTWTNFKDFPTTSVAPEDQWAYAGSTVSGAVGASSFASLYADYMGTGFVSSANEWIAYKIKVPKTAEYRLSSLTTYKYHNSTSYLEVYCFPSDGRFIEGNAIYGTVNAPLKAGSYAYRSGFTTFNNLGIENPVLLGKGSENVTSENAGAGEVILTDKGTVSLTAGEEYILLFNNAYAGGVITVGTVTLSETTAEDEIYVNKNPEYIFKSDALKDPSSVGTNLFAINDFSMINTDISSPWCVVAYPNIVNKQIDSGVSLFCTEGGKTNYLGNNALVMKIVTDTEGIYTPTIVYQETSASGLVDFYAISADDTVDFDMTNLSDVQAAIKKADHFASIDQHSEATTDTPFVGNDMYLSAGENYIIAVISKGCGESDHTSSRYYGYINSLSLAHKEGIAINGARTINLERKTTLSLKALDDNNAPLDATVTYESSAPSVASVDANTGVVTGVGEGKAIITATAVTENGTYTDSIEIEVKAIYDPQYVFNYKAITDKSLIYGTGGSQAINISSVTNESLIDPDVSSGIWTGYGVINFKTASLYSNGTQMRANYSTYGEDNAIVLRAKLDKPGAFLPEVSYSKNAANGTTNIYIVPKSYAEEKNFNMATIEGVNAAKTDSAIAGSEVVLAASVDMHANTTDANPCTGNIVNIPEREFYIVMNVTPGCGESNSGGDFFSMISTLTLTKTNSISATSADTALEVGEKTTLSAKAYDNRDNEISAEVTYENLTPDVVTVSGNAVTAVAVGDAKIKATATIDGVAVTDIITIKVTPKKISVATNIGDELKVNSDVYMGAEVTVTAPEISGKVFRHWVLGTEENGIPVSESATYTFTALTNTYLTAVYSDAVADDAKVVEFYLENGGFVGSAVANEEGKVELPDAPSITGYVFSAWMTDAKTAFTADTIVEDLLTKVVGTFNAETITDTEYSYGDKIENKSDTAKIWKRNDKVVAYGTEYTYYVWADFEITSEDGEKPTEPIIVLDNNGKRGGARMIEYDAAGFEIVEAGILFGDGYDMTVDSCMYKAKSSRNLSHGQFTAKPVNSDYDTARGYVVYVAANGDYQVVYSH